ncbi:hypothetical protein PsYK624_122070 [Phanerochaete sordida]|uniref:Uncharacterized protein n=1 Tax=Phanerochaete sordida TaxID=48140 RepID=A0A9P3GKM4_9APHY|nr:hypothetical protein PsYK624_122070 [Phanerochaete sordida]
MAHLPQTEFWCIIRGGTGSCQPSREAGWHPFAALPRVPPSFHSLRLSVIQITSAELKSTAELARLVDSYPTLQVCYFSELKFLDPTPINQVRRISRKVPGTFWQCKISACTDMSISAQARLALDLLAAAPRLGLAAADPQWTALLDTLLASVPSDYKQAVIQLQGPGGRDLDGHAPGAHMANQTHAVDAQCMIVTGRVVLAFSPTDTSDRAELEADVWVKLKGGRMTPTHAEDGSTHVSGIGLSAGFAVAGDGDPPSFDGFREATDSVLFDQLQFYVREGSALDERGMQALLRAVLRREQLIWALSRGILRLELYRYSGTFWDSIACITNKDILSALAEHSLPTVEDAPPTLDGNEYAEYLSLFLEDKRASYLQRLPALRSERAKAKAPLSEGTHTAADEQNVAALGTHASTAGGGDEHDEESQENVQENR